MKKVLLLFRYILLLAISYQYINAQEKDSIITLSEVSVKNTDNKVCVKKFKKTALLKPLQLNNISFDYKITDTVTVTVGTGVCSKNMKIDTLTVEGVNKDISLYTERIKQLLKIIYTPFYIIKDTPIKNNFKCVENEDNSWEFMAYSDDKRLELEESNIYNIKVNLNPDGVLYEISVRCFLEDGQGYTFTSSYKYEKGKYFISEVDGRILKTGTYFYIRFKY